MVHTGPTAIGRGGRCREFAEGSYRAPVFAEAGAVIPALTLSPYLGFHHFSSWQKVLEISDTFLQTQLDASGSAGEVQ